VSQWDLQGSLEPSFPQPLFPSIFANPSIKPQKSELKTEDWAQIVKFKHSLLAYLSLWAGFSCHYEVRTGTFVYVQICVQAQQYFKITRVLKEENLVKFDQVFLKLNFGQTWFPL
jgi:hypothetical protein